MNRQQLNLVVCICSLTFVPSLRGEVKVEPDKENVVASRLEGDWQPDPDLSQRLTGNENAAMIKLIISFKSDPATAEKIPAKYEKFLANKQVYLAGILTIKGEKTREHPFILIEHRGNPHVVFFRERNEDPFGDAESFNVMLARARERQHDLLFIGGDFNNQPFMAFSRVKAEE